jgi:hypothetical protein
MPKDGITEAGRTLRQLRRAGSRMRESDFSGVRQ